MRNNQLTAVFLGLFFLSTLGTAVLIFKYNSSIHQSQRIQAGVMTINALQSLFNEANEYSKTHPDMKAVLQSFTSAPKPAAPATTNRPGK
jgi:hypothetical protein